MHTTITHAITITYASKQLQGISIPQTPLITTCTNVHMHTTIMHVFQMVCTCTTQTPLPYRYMYEHKASPKHIHTAITHAITISTLLNQTTTRYFHTIKTPLIAIQTYRYMYEYAVYSTHHHYTRHASKRCIPDNNHKVFRYHTDSLTRYKYEHKASCTVPLHMPLCLYHKYYRYMYEYYTSDVVRQVLCTVHSNDTYNYIEMEQ